MNTLDYFKEISAIPRESGKEEKIANYLCTFAEQHHLFYMQDAFHNVVIKKKTLDVKPLILQAHTDMVCEKVENNNFDFSKDSIKLLYQDGYIKADGTSLGADNGIGIAQILMILASDLKCNIEAVFTSSEETTMNGAIHFDANILEGRSMLNLDGFDENTIISEAACFYDLILKTNYQFIKKKQKGYKISIRGLLGGHSGFEINKNRGNAIILLVKLLSTIKDIEISNLEGGTKFNVIPSHAYCSFYSSYTLEQLNIVCSHFIQENHKIYPTMEIQITEEKILDYLNCKDSITYINNLLLFPHGIMFQNQNCFPTTSVNLGIADLKNNVLKIGMRSSKKEEEKICLERLQKYCSDYQYEFIIYGHQPGFESKSNSPIINTLLKTSPYSKKTMITPVHITVEVGFFQEKIPNLDVAIICPHIEGAHTVNEKVEIESIMKTDQWLKDFIIAFQQKNQE